MQSLYAYEQNTLARDAQKSIQISENNDTKRVSEGIEHCKKFFEGEVTRSAALFYLLLSYVCHIAKYVEKDAERRASKYLATEEDKKVNTKLAQNSLITELWCNKGFQDHRKIFKTDNDVNEGWVKKLFRQLIETKEYDNYLQDEKVSSDADNKIGAFIWNGIMLQNDFFLNDLSEDWMNWEDDVDMIKILIGNCFSRPGPFRFGKFISEEKKKYAEELLQTVIEKQDYLLQLIKPKLKNWEAERIAQIDMVVLKMGLAEFLYFPTIPEKVTINEYIEIAKNYSTDQSGQFVNGVLDSLKNDLLHQNKLRKIQSTK